MISKTIKYVDYNGVEKSGTYWFNMSRADLLKLELETEEGWADRVKKLISEQNVREVIKLITQFVDDAYGVKTPDGSFKKSPELLEAFKQTDAYSELLWEFVERPDEFGDFINGIVSSVKKSVDAIDVDAEIEKAKAAGTVVNFVTPKNP
jgi:hypothetical protein